MSRRGAAFTLIELLVVLVIIGIIIAIVLPALGLVRNATRKTATEGMLRNITNAVGSFQAQERRMPGHFTAKEMADSTNATAAYGFANMQNVMLSLAGYQTGTTMIGPSGTAQLGVEANSIGLPGGGNNKLYWVPDGKHLKAQNEAGQQIGNPANVAWASVIDDWGNPILAHVEDETAVGTVKTVDQFAQKDSTTVTAPAHFYWASNAAFLKADAFGKRSVNQLDPASGTCLVENDVNLKNSIAGMLGNPNNPYKDPTLVSSSMPYPVPASARAPFMVHSAGTDGVFVGKRDRGFKQFKHGFIDYRMNFAPDVDTAISSTNQWTDKNDKGTGNDVMSKFDDLLMGGGN